MINDKIVEIMNILYLRIMSLNFNYRYIAVLISHTGIESEFPDMCDGLLWMFSSDAYITIRGMFSNGTYTFNMLKNKDDNLCKAVEIAENKINIIIPNFVNIRNHTFAHFIDKRNPKVASDMFMRFPEIFDVLTCLHKECCSILKISEKDLNVYDSKTFAKIDERFNAMSDMLVRGFISFHRDKLYSNLGVVPDNNFPLPKRFPYMNQHIPFYYRIYLRLSDFVDKLKFGKSEIRRVKTESEEKKS